MREWSERLGRRRKQPHWKRRIGAHGQSRKMQNGRRTKSGCAKRRRGCSPREGGHDRERELRKRKVTEAAEAAEPERQCEAQRVSNLIAQEKERATIKRGNEEEYRKLAQATVGVQKDKIRPVREALIKRYCKRRASCRWRGKQPYYYFQGRCRAHGRHYYCATGRRQRGRRVCRCPKCGTGWWLECNRKFAGGSEGSFHGLKREN